MFRQALFPTDFSAYATAVMDYLPVAWPTNDAPKGTTADPLPAGL